MPGIDIYNLEAEAYGGRIDKPYDINIPAIAGPIFDATVQLQEVRKVRSERATGKHEASSFELKLIEVLIRPIRIQNSVPNLAPAVQSQRATSWGDGWR